MPAIPKLRQIAAVSAAALLTACAAPLTFENVYEAAGGAGGPYSSILVVAAAKNYDRRAEFESKLAGRLRDAGAEATAYHSVRPGNEALTRAEIRQAVGAGDYDAVLFTRILSAERSVDVREGASTAVAERRDGGVVDLFRYDYNVIDDPDVVTVENSGVLLTELYAAGDESRR